MKSMSKIGLLIGILLSALTNYAQIKNAETVKVHINGNCEMCKEHIEKAGEVKDIAAVAWDSDTHIATLSYNPQKTSQDELLKRIALAGYDNPNYLAPDDVYAKLPACCQYERTLKTPTEQDQQAAATSIVAENTEATQLQGVFAHYFLVKDALVNDDEEETALQAMQLKAAIQAVAMDALNTEQHAAWMKVASAITLQTDHLVTSKEISKQRASFALLSEQLFPLAKLTQGSAAMYYQYCPMYNNGKGANWLSKEEAIKNPYFGSKMLQCGRVVETIKQL